MTVLLNETAELDAYLGGYLEADAELMAMLDGGVFPAIIGYSSDSLPVVRYYVIEQSDVMVVEMHRVWNEIVMQVEVVTNGPDPTEALAISKRLDELLHRVAPGDVGNISVLQIYRRQSSWDRTVESSNEYIYAGGEYVFLVQAS